MFSEMDRIRVASGTCRSHFRTAII